MALTVRLAMLRGREKTFSVGFVRELTEAARDKIRGMIRDKIRDIIISIISHRTKHCTTLRSTTPENAHAEMITFWSEADANGEAVTEELTSGGAETTDLTMTMEMFMDSGPNQDTQDTGNAGEHNGIKERGDFDMVTANRPKDYSSAADKGTQDADNKQRFEAIDGAGLEITDMTMRTGELRVSSERLAERPNDVALEERMSMNHGMMRQGATRRLASQVTRKRNHWKAAELERRVEVMVTRLTAELISVTITIIVEGRGRIRHIAALRMKNYATRCTATAVCTDANDQEGSDNVIVARQVSWDEAILWYETIDERMKEIASTEVRINDFAMTIERLTISQSRLYK